MQIEGRIWKDRNMAARALAEIGRLSKNAGVINIMEVCGTHTMAIAASGMRRLLPKGLKMLSGPGCPVCVTAPGDVDRAVKIAQKPGVILATFGDMLKVRGSAGSLEDARISGADVRIVYSPLDAVTIAKENTDKKIVFLGVGFETTAPLIGSAVLEAEKEDLGNFFVLPLFKLVPPALKAVLSDPAHKIHGFLLPGHVSAIIGTVPYKFVARDYHVPCAIAGFEPLDILNGIHRILIQRERNKADIEIEYSRTVRPEGNVAALKVLEQVFEPADANWRAVGGIPKSGLVFGINYLRFDAGRYFDVPYIEATEPEGCLCGQVLMGKVLPKDCALFGKLRTPSSAAGPCMVSSEGACAAWYKYGEQ